MGTVSDDECVTVNSFVVSEIVGSRIRLDRVHYDSIHAVLGLSLNNVDQVYIGDKARVTMALMPDMKTVYCVKASVTEGEGLAGRDMQDSGTVHMPINSMGIFTHSAHAHSTHRKILQSRGLDANGTYVGIGRLAEALKLVKKAFKASRKHSLKQGRMREVMVNGQMVAVTRTIPKVVSETKEHEQPQLTSLSDAPILPTPSVSPDSGASEETKVEEKKRPKREQSPEHGAANHKKVKQEIVEQDAIRPNRMEIVETTKHKTVEKIGVESHEIQQPADTVGMSCQEITERVTIAIAKSPQILQLMANIDAELVAEIVRRKLTK